ncbi:MAG: NAD(P)/FAD-dependent oxidoreductase [Coriobacteriales bacterium]|jgi:2,4-dienoyl-CoA reductase-like NADH-dependent reductase (Old Yellow Enzyme family)/thioredoxin reductase|nr:NAD(P)/FAD-dependent oxidoreductase [Coriobacteriales bacterium]
MGSSYKRCFTPITIKGLEFKNRIVCTPHVPGWGSREGVLTAEQSAFYEGIASSGAAIVTLGNCSVQMKECSDEIHQLDLSDDKVIFGLSNLQKRMRRYGTNISAQINYCGRNAWWPGSTRYAPSPITAPGTLERCDLMGIHPEPVYELTKEHIYQIIDWYAEGAARLKTAGFKMLQIHFAHNNLVGQFFSPISNFRTDEYGFKNMETRTRFAREVLTAIRKRVGEDFVIDLRYSSEDVLPGALSQEDAIEIAQIIEPWVDIFTISRAFHNAPMSIGAETTLSYYSPEITLKEFTKPFKAALKNSKVVLTTSVVNLDNAEEVLEEGVADFVGMFRPFLADKDIITKYARDQVEEVNQCIRCEYHWSFAPEFKPVPCAVNPICGHELEFPDGRLPKADPVKRILVVGSGPAGLQAALSASSRGHEVILAEKDDHLGGNLIKAADVAFKSEFKKFVNWIIPRVEKGASEILLNTEVDAALVDKIKPDALIIAAGAADVVPPIPGVDKAHVRFAWEADNGSVKPGRDVVVIGAGLVGTESAIQIAEAGQHSVTIVELLDEGAAMMGKGMLAAPAVSRAEAAGVVTLYQTQVVEIRDRSVLIRGVDGIERELAADTVLLAAGIRPRKDVVEALRHSIAENDVYLVGDLIPGGGTIGHATTTAFEVAAHI